MRETNMNCERVDSIIASWQGSGVIGEEELLALSHHVDECESCRTTYRLVLPLIARDVHGATEVADELEQVDEGFTRRVMSRIRGGRRTVPIRPGVSAARWAIPAAAAAAVLLLAIGLLVRSPAGSGQSAEVTVHFVLDAPGAQRVALVGSFNAWDPDSLLLKRAPGSQRWEISLKLKRGETYLYNFVVNGDTWIPDPTTDLQVADGFGGESSLMQL